MNLGPTQELTLVLGTLLPLLTGWVVRQDAHPGFRAVMLLFLSGVTSFLTSWLDSLNNGVAFSFTTVLATALGTFLVGVGTHYGLWRHLGFSDLMKKLPGFIGPIYTPPAPVASEHGKHEES